MVQNSINMFYFIMIYGIREECLELPTVSDLRLKLAAGKQNFSFGSSVRLLLLGYFKSGNHRDLFNDLICNLE